MGGAVSPHTPSTKPSDQTCRWTSLGKPRLPNLGARFCGVTLVLGMSKPEGLYLSVDFRLTNSATGALIDDGAPKFLEVQFVPFEGGPRALLAYTGVAYLGGTPTATWIRETLRGEAWTFDDAMKHLQSRLNRDFGPLGHPLIINGLVVFGGRRYVLALSNVLAAGGQAPRFELEVREVGPDYVFANGSGWRFVARDGHLERMRSLIKVVPRRPSDFMNLLATINRKVASRAPTVSPFCKVAFVSDRTGFSNESRTYLLPGESVPFDWPFLLGPLDLSNMLKYGYDSFVAGQEGKEPPALPDWNAGLAPRG